ncbi:MAG: YitT family protein [Oscillospiraceae bacterium]
MAETRRQKAENFLLDTVFDILGSVLYSGGIYVFAKMADFAPGGISGLAIMLNYLWNLPIGLMTIVINIPLMIISYKFVGKKFLLKSLRSMVYCTVFLDVIFPHFPSYHGSSLLAALYSGLFIGAGMAMLYMRGSSSGGTDFLTMSIKAKKPHLSVGSITMAIDFIIISLGWAVFGNIDAVLYGLIATFTASVVINKIMYGMGSAKLLIIITDKPQLVTDKISEISERGSTVIDAVGSYTKENKNIVMCACSNAQAYKIKTAAKDIDENIFVIVADASEIYGFGFARRFMA